MKKICKDEPKIGDTLLAEEQVFSFPPAFIIEMAKQINGMPSDIAFEDYAEHIELYSIEFKSDQETLNIIPDGDGWKVEGT